MRELQVSFKSECSSLFEAPFALKRSKVRKHSKSICLFATLANKHSKIFVFHYFCYHYYIACNFCQKGPFYYFRSYNPKKKKNQTFLCRSFFAITKVIQKSLKEIASQRVKEIANDMTCLLL